MLNMIQQDLEQFLSARELKFCFENEFDMLYEFPKI